MNTKRPRRPTLPHAYKESPALTRLVDLPHDMLWERVQFSMLPASRARSETDAIWHVLKRRLPQLDPQEHMKYIELECARIVEMLRAVRDEYRAYLTQKGYKPVTEMHWVVFRFGVTHWAIYNLRSTILDYFVRSQIERKHWRLLYDFSSPTVIKPDGPPRHLDDFEELIKTIKSHLGKKVFDQWAIGGPFGRDGQVFIARSRPWNSMLTGKRTLARTIVLRQRLWDKGFPWTEGIARLFDCAQEEIMYQHALLTEEARLAEGIFVKLSELEQIAHRHLVTLKPNRSGARNFSRDHWLALLRELDQSEVLLDDALEGKAKEVLVEVRRKGPEISSWEACYESKARVSLEDGKIYGLKREVTHAIHNAAKTASYQLGKVWGPAKAK